MPRPWSSTTMQTSGAPAASVPAGWAARRMVVSERGELDGVGDQFAEHLEDALLVGKDDGFGGRLDLEADLGLGGGAVRDVGGAAQHVDGFDGLPMQRQAPVSHAVEIENVVDQADKPVAVADGHVDHLALLFGALVERAGGDQTQRRAQRGERGAQLVADGGDELVLHFFQAAALRNVLKGHYHAGDDAVLHDGVGAVLDGNGSAVLAPEDFVAHANGFGAAQRLEDGIGGF